MYCIPLVITHLNLYSHKPSKHKYIGTPLQVRGSSARLVYLDLHGAVPPLVRLRDPRVREPHPLHRGWSPDWRGGMHVSELAARVPVGSWSRLVWCHRRTSEQGPKVWVYLGISRVARTTSKCSLLESMRYDLSIDVIWNLLDNANGDGLDEICVELGEGSQDLVGAIIVSEPYFFKLGQGKVG